VLVVAAIRSEIPTDITGILMLIHFLIAVYVSGRIDERIQRLQFLWTQEVGVFVVDVMFCCSLYASLNRGKFNLLTLSSF